jgi:hypothetical protein
LLFKAASSSLQTLAWDSKFIGGKLAMMAVLHTWTRALIYHPHLHFIIPGGGLWEDNNLWLNSSENFLVPVLALSKLFRAKIEKLIENYDTKLYKSIPHKVWNQKWVVHSKAVGAGQKAVQYLSNYVFRPAISNNKLISMDNNNIVFKYIDNETKVRKTVKLSSEEFIRRYLQHVLPTGFVKVRYFGLFSNTNRKLLAEVKESLSGKSKDNINNNQKEEKTKTSFLQRGIICPHCNKIMRNIGSLPKLQLTDKSPPDDYFSNLLTPTN